jgi:carbon monoxide dehydrogenase subunit G
MNLQGSVIIAAPRPRVWEALNTPEVLARCIEGVERLERIAGPDGERLEGRMNAKVGPVRATFTGFVTLQDVVEGQSYRLVGEGKGGVAGFARGEADVTLTDQDGGTLLAYEVRSSVGGKLAQLGARLIEGTAKAYAEGFFARLKAEVEVTDTAPEPAQEAAPDPNPAQTPDQTPEPATRGLSPSVWAGLLILAVLGILAWQWN